MCTSAECGPQKFTFDDETPFKMQRYRHAAHQSFARRMFANIFIQSGACVLVSLNSAFGRAGVLNFYEVQRISFFPPYGYYVCDLFKKALLIPKL